MAGLRTTLARIKRSLLKKAFIKDKKMPAFWMDQMLGDKSIFLVQIGSNDGKTGDPLFSILQKNKNWKALFVEPIPQAFEKLKNNYPDTKRFRFENVAVNEGQKMTFYSVDSAAKKSLPDLPYWFNQLGSFDKQHILKHLDGALEPFIRAQELEGVSLKTLFERNQITSISVLHIDSEGYDWKILSQFDLEKYEPKFILFEHNHLSEEERNAAINFLQEKYVLFQLGIDILAVCKKNGEKKISEMEKHFGKRLK